MQEDEAKEKLAKAERADRKNRNTASVHGDFGTYTEEGEVRLKRAAKLHDEARTRRVEAVKRSEAAGIAAATHILELTKTAVDAQAKKTSPVEIDLSAIKQEMSQIRQDLLQTKTSLTAAAQDVSELKNDAQQSKADAQITSKRFDTMADSQMRVTKGLSCDTEEVRLRHKDLRTTMEILRSECKPIFQQVQVCYSDLNELREDYGRCKDLGSELGNLRKENEATAQDVKSLQTTVRNLRELSEGG